MDSTLGAGSVVQMWCVDWAASWLAHAAHPPKYTPVTVVMKWMHSWPEKRFLGEIRLRLCPSLLSRVWHEETVAVAIEIISASAYTQTHSAHTLHRYNYFMHAHRNVAYQSLFLSAACGGAKLENKSRQTTQSWNPWFIRRCCQKVCLLLQEKKDSQEPKWTRAHFGTLRTSPLSFSFCQTSTYTQTLTFCKFSL